MSEEARLNKLIKNIDDMKKDMKEDKIRVVMELEREEEGIVNGLMGRLEDVRREKRMLEQRVYSGGVGGGGGFGGDEFENMMNMMDQQQQQQQQQQGQQQIGVPSLVGPFGRMGMDAQDTTPNTGGANDSSSSSPLPASSTPSAIDVFPCLKEDEANDEEEDEEEEEEEEEDFNDDILGGRHHDAEMEEELEKMLQMKDSKK